MSNNNGGILRARLVHQKDRGTTIELYYQPLHALLLEEIGAGILEWRCTPERSGPVCSLLLGSPDWLWHVRWGPRDEYGIADRSLGHQLHRLGQWMASGFGTWKLDESVGHIPVTPEWMQEHFPDAGWPFADDPGEDMSVSDDAHRPNPAPRLAAEAEPDWGQDRQVGPDPDQQVWDYLDGPAG